MAIVLGVSVLFFALGMFSGNLSEMVAKNSLTKSINAGNTAKTDPVIQNRKRDSVKTETAQVVTDLMADPDALLQQYLDAAQAVIDRYKANPPTTPEQYAELAKALTQKYLANVHSLPENGMAGVTVYDGYTKINDQRINWNTSGLDTGNAGNCKTLIENLPSFLN